MDGTAPLDSLAAAVRDSGLVGERSSGVALCSGGADSSALLAGLARACGPGRVLALHLNYGLRPDSAEDERSCRQLCERVGVELIVERPELPAQGNLQALARDARYAAAQTLRSERGLDWIATGHTRTDLAETVVYRLATSPGRRALLGLAPRRGVVVRPLLGLGRERVRELAEEAGLPFRDDPSNAEPRFARNRIRNEVMPVLGEIGPAAEETITETQAELREESEALERLAAEVIRSAGSAGAVAIAADALAGLDPAIRRLAPSPARRAGRGRAGGTGPRALGCDLAPCARSPRAGWCSWAAAWRLASSTARSGLRSDPTPRRPRPRSPFPAAAASAPGRCAPSCARRPRRRPAPRRRRSIPATLARTLVVRPWRDGDRMRPLGLGGTKSLQDLFTDRKVPRSLRRTLPVVTSGGRIAWIAGVAVSEEFAAPRSCERPAVLSASSSS